MKIEVEDRCYGGKRFGHTITTVKRTKKLNPNDPDNIIVLFGGAVGDNQYKITNDTLVFNQAKKIWTPMYLKGDANKPSPRAAHAATAVENSQLVIFGGAHSHGQMVDNDLYLLKINDNVCKYIKVPIDSEKPLARYGHTMIFTKPYILLIGGNVANEPSNEVWSLSIDNSPFQWNKVHFQDNAPPPRVYHSVSLWQSANKGDMVLVYGGRDKKNQPLNDLWGLRLHNNGVWDWNKAPNKFMQNAELPSSRYQHTSVCLNNLFLVIGGRCNRPNVDLPMDVYNLYTCKWGQFPGVVRFRHSSFLINNDLYVHAGFEPENPSTPTDLTTVLPLSEVFQGYPELMQNLIPEPKTNKGLVFQNYNLNPQVHVVHTINEQTNPNMIKLVHIDNLASEPQRLDPSDYQVYEKKTGYVDTLFSTILVYFLKPREWNTLPKTSSFVVKKEIILSLCDEAIKVLKKSPTLVYLRPGVKIFGSIHGQYAELLRFFDTFGVPDNDPAHKKIDIEALDFLFLGNYVDRGKHSLEVILMLLALKLKFPQQIHLLRGSHEDIEINKKDGLAFECESRLNDNIDAPNSVFKKLNEVFEYLPLAAVLGNKILCVHSGIGKHIDTLEQIAKIKRPFKLNHNDQTDLNQKIVFDLLWSDPVLDLDQAEDKKNEIREYIAKGQIVRFGTNRIKNFMKKNRIEIIIRSHECVMQGCEKFGDTNLYTVFSLSGYGGIYQNDSGILHYKKGDNTLKTLCLSYIPNFTDWFNLKELRNNWKPMSQQVNERVFDPKDRPVTPPRQYIKKMSKK